MNLNYVPRLATPLLLAAAIIVSFGTRRDPAPVEVEPGEPAPPDSAAFVSAARQLLATGEAAPGFDRGTSRAPVTILEFADFGCRYCASFAANAYPPLAAEFVATGKVRWKYVPFVMGIFANGAQAARAGTCAGDQGPAAFGRMHDLLYAEQATWEGAADADPLMHALASRARLDVARFDACYASAAAAQRVRAASDLADRMGVRATPTFFLNGARIEGAPPADQFRAAIIQVIGETR